MRRACHSKPLISFTLHHGRRRTSVSGRKRPRRDNRQAPPGRLMIDHIHENRLRRNSFSNGWGLIRALGPPWVIRAGQLDVSLALAIAAINPVVVGAAPGERGATLLWPFPRRRRLPALGAWARLALAASPAGRRRPRAPAFARPCVEGGLTPPVRLQEGKVHGGVTTLRASPPQIGAGECSRARGL